MVKGSLRIGKVGGVPIEVHWSFSLLVLFVVLTSGGHGTAPVLWSLVWVAALFACVTVHELSHCAVALHRGLAVEGIVLLPIGGMSRIAGLPGPPAIERDVAIAGPLASIGLAGLLGLAAYASGAHVWPPTLFAGPWLCRLAWLNLLLAGFNLLPALPMDGGRVLRALLAERHDPSEATEIAAFVAQVIAVGMLVVGFVVDLWLLLIGIFVLLAASSERRTARVERSLRGLRVGDVMARDETAAPAEVTVGEVGYWLSAYPGRGVPVVEGGRVVGIVSAVDIVGRPAGERVGDACDRSSPICEPSTPLFPDALELLARHRRSEFAVAESGRPVGVLYRATLRGLLERAPLPVAAGASTTAG